MEHKEQAPAEGWQGAENLNKDTNNLADRQSVKPIFTELQNDADYNLDKMENEHEAGILRIRSGNRRMTDAQSQPIPEDLYHGLMYSGEMTILFADTGIGKSIFAFQIAVEIANKGHDVLYVDLELSDKQFEARYSDNYHNPFIFSNKIHFGEISVDAVIPVGWTYEDYFIESLIREINKTGVKIIIIDNMTKIVNTDTDKANTAKPLMDRLVALKREYGLTLLLLEHTRKTEMYRTISINDLQGSKMKVNFADAVISIGRSSKGVDIRYIKQVKCRSTEIIYHTDNVIVYQIKKENSFLHFDFIGYDSEYEHLKIPDENTLSERNAEIQKMKKENYSNVEIAKHFNISEGAVRKVLKKSEDNQ